MTGGGRFSRQAWLELGLDQLRAMGPAGLTVDQLCGAAGRTRGSFYHHFEDHDAFIRALMEWWKTRNTDDLIDQALQQERTVDRFETLNTLTAALDHHLEARVRQLAQSQPAAAEIVSQVDEIRISFVAALYKEFDRNTAKTARRFAQLEYAVFVGMQMIWPDRPAKELESLGKLYGKMAASFVLGGGDQDVV